LREDNENEEEVDNVTNKMRGVHKALDDSAGCGQNSRRECGLRTKHRFGQEAYTKKAVDLVKNKSKKV